MKTTIRKTIWTNFAAMAVILTIVAVGCKKKEDDTPVDSTAPVVTLLCFCLMFIY